jgi:hypothetical protein
MGTPASHEGTSSVTTTCVDQAVTSAVPARPVGPSNRSGTAGFVLGILGAVFCWVPVFGFVFGVLAVVFGGLGVAAANCGEATNWTVVAWGLGLGIFAIAFWPLFILIASVAIL